MHLGEFLDGVLWSKVAVAIFCGGIVGVERQLRGKPAGMRTSSLICLGTMMFVHLGHELTGGSSGADPTRVLGQVVSGIGFLGAGVIMTRNGLLTGVTSAAVVWVLAAVGAAVGAGKFAEAITMSVTTVSILVGVERLERAFAALRRGVHAEPPKLHDETVLEDMETVQRPRNPRHGSVSGGIDLRGSREQKVR
ncbi:MAG: MgtC/SapB family protein [Myxococcales bacterium]